MKNNKKKKATGTMIEAYMSTLRVPHKPSQTIDNKKRKLEKKALAKEMRQE